MISEAIDTLIKFSIPLYVDDEYGRPEQFGTGFFVRAEESLYLISAAHVLDNARTNKVYLYSTPKIRRYLTGKVITTGHPDQRDEDVVDIGVLKMTGEALPPYSEVDKFPMDVSYLTPEYLPRSGKHYVIVGFPASKSRVDTIDRTTIAAPYAYRSDSIDDSEYARHGVNAETHVVLPLDVRKGMDADGLVRTFPKPNGMSGSPIVVLYESETEDRSGLFPVVAVGTTYRKSTKVLIGGDVQFALNIIRKFAES